MSSGEKPKLSAIEHDSVGIQVANAQAPFIYYDFVTASGCTNGIVWLTLERSRHTLRDQQPIVDSVVACHMRMSLNAAHQLRKALEAVELAMARPTGTPN